MSNDSRLKIQTKYTPPSGQDPKNLPYDLRSSLETQIHTSIASSLKNLSLSESSTPDDSTYIDTLILHSPLTALPETLAAWQTFETYVPHRIHHLGISNTNLRTLRTLFEEARIKPSIVQNRFYTGTRHDAYVRRFCKDKGIVYQSFWTLTGNPDLLSSRVVAEVAQEVGVEKEMGLYLCVMGLGDVSVLNGTTNQERMKEDLEGLKKWEEWVQKEDKRSKWEEIMHKFKELIGEEVVGSGAASG